MYSENVKYISTNKFYSYIERTQNNIFNIYDEILPPNESRILKAMLLGNKTFLSDEIVQIYKSTGIYHILAISGLHISILCLLSTIFLGKLLKKYNYLLTIFVLIFYCIFTGASLSTVRATIMYITVLIGYMLRKTPDFPSSISLSCIILLIIKPYNLFDIGFLYSYISVFSIAFLGVRFAYLYNFKRLRQAFVISFFVSLAIKPITAFYFIGRFYKYFSIAFCIYNSIGRAIQHKSCSYNNRQYILYSLLFYLHLQNNGYPTLQQYYSR